MPAYVLVRIKVTDPERFKPYVEASTKALELHGGRFLARGGKTEVLEGPAEGRRVTVIEFPDMDKARAWFHSPEYQAARAFRLEAAQAEFLLVEGR